MSLSNKTHQNNDQCKKSEKDSEIFLPEGNAAQSNMHSKKEHASELNSKWMYYKQVLAVGVGWMFLFMATNTLRSLQSSINHSNDIGLISMGCFYGGMMIGSFISSAIVQTFGPKLTLAISTVFHIAFVAANIYPNIVLLATVGLVTGISHSSLWAAQSTFLTVLAKSFSKKYNVAYESILARFFGISFLFSEMSVVIGNPLAILLLNLERMLNDSPIINVTTSEPMDNILLNNETQDYGYYSANEGNIPFHNGSEISLFCGRHFCHSQDAVVTKLLITDWTRYVVVGAYVFSVVVSLLIFLVVIDDKAIYHKIPGWSDLPDKIMETLKFIPNVKVILFMPMSIFFGLQMAFVAGDVVKAYVSCPVGLSHVGKVMLSYGILDALSSLVAGWVKKFIGSCMVFTVIVVLNSVLFLAIFLWHPDDSAWGYVLFAGFGCIQGFTNVHMNSQYGTIFRENVESAFSVYRLFVAMGLAFGFTYSPYFCMNTKIWVTFSLFVVSTVCYYALEIIHKRSTGKQHLSENTDLEI